MKIKFTIPGQIGGKGRPKFTTIGGFARAYTPSQTVNAEAMIRSFAAEAMRGLALFEGALGLSVTIYKQAPQSWSKKKRAEAFFVTGKCDVDNSLKLIGDACNGVIWHDDSQIAIAFIARYYSGDSECVDVEVAHAAEMSIALHDRPQLLLTQKQKQNAVPAQG